MEAYPSGWRGQFAKLLGFARAARVQIPQLPPEEKYFLLVLFFIAQYSCRDTYKYVIEKEEFEELKNKIKIILNIIVKE